jgi:hypothetical protein
MDLTTAEWFYEEDSCERMYYRVCKEARDSMFSQLGRGDCFEKNYDNFHKLVKDNPLIKYVILRVKYNSGDIITHAACYDGDYKIDESQGTQSKMDRMALEKSRYSRNYTHPHYEILGYKIYDKDTIPSLETICCLYRIEGGLGKFTNGVLPKLTGKWENAKNKIIDL